MKEAADIMKLVRARKGGEIIGYQSPDKHHDDWTVIFKLGVMRVIASSGLGWDHVSVSLKSRCPRWEEMETIRKLCFLADEVVIQYGVPMPSHINDHPYCLHMWRPHHEAIPMPPVELV